MTELQDFMHCFYIYDFKKINIYIQKLKPYVPSHWVKVLFTCQTSGHNEILSSFYNNNFEWLYVYLCVGPCPPTLQLNFVPYVTGFM